MVNTTDIQTQNPQSDNSLPPSAVEQPAYATTGLMLNALQATATELYELGFNVFPVPFAQKGGWPWRTLQYTRVHADQLPSLFWDRCNPAVMAGRTSGNLFIIDCETRQAFEEQGALLRQHHIPIWAVRSGGAKSGGHYYLRCAEGEVANLLPGAIPDVEVRGNRCYVLAPPAVHPDTGVVYQWHQRDGDHPPLVSLSDISWLPLKLTARAKRTVPQASTALADLSRTTRDFILHGVAQGSRNNRLFAAACDMAGNDYSEETIHQVLCPVAEKCGLGQQEIRDTLNSALRQPRTPSRKFQHTHLRPHDYQKAIAWAEQQTWSGRTGQSDRAVFLACCERARLGANEFGVFRASVREVAGLARVSTKTASAALKRLQKANRIIKVGFDQTSKASLFKFVPAVLDQGERNYHTSPTWQSSSVVITLFGDACERGALGPTGAQVYHCLLSNGAPMKPRSLVRCLHLSRYQVARALRKLKDYGLGRRERKGWVAIRRDAAWLDENVAAKAGTLGKGAARRAKHAAERAKRAGNEILRAQWAARRREMVILAAVKQPPPMGRCTASTAGRASLSFRASTRRPPATSVPRTSTGRTS